MTKRSARVAIGVMIESEPIGQRLSAMGGAVTAGNGEAIGNLFGVEWNRQVTWTTITCSKPILLRASGRLTYYRLECRQRDHLGQYVVGASLRWSGCPVCRGTRVQFGLEYASCCSLGRDSLL